LAASLDIPFLGAIPLGAAVREEGDRGVPTVIGRPDSPEGKALTAVSRAALAALEAKMLAVATPA
jgi:ATP-binding protein involved in chromosome partitioning